MSEGEYLKISSYSECENSSLTGLRFIRLLNGIRKLQMGMSTKYTNYNSKGIAISSGVNIVWTDVPTVDEIEII